MITLFSGMLGSGKSYKMVAELSRCKDKYFVVHNIEKLKEGYLGEYGINWIEYCAELKIEVDVFFSKPYQIEYSKAIFEKYHRPILIIIDEAHEWFDHHVRTFKMWLSYSRHLDQDIWLVAHRSTNIPAVYRSFVEVEYRAKSGSFIFLPKIFLYNRILGGQGAGFTYEKKDQKIFELYKSKDIHSDKKVHNSKMLPFMIVFSICGVVLFFWLPSKAMTHKKAITKQESKVSSTVPVNPVANQLINYDKSSVLNDGIAIEEKFAFVGSFAGDIVLEDRKSGVQSRISQMPQKFKLVKFDRGNYCILSDGFHHYTLYNYARFIFVPRQSDGQNTFMMAAGDGRQQRPIPAAVENPVN